MKKKLFICFISFFLVSALFSVQKSVQTKNNSKVVITGYVTAKGNVPFVYPSIRSEDGKEFNLICKEKDKQKLLNAQGSLIKFTGKLDEDGTFILKKWKKVK